MKFEKVIQGRLARKSREARPFSSAFAVLNELLPAIEHLLEEDNPQFQSILERSIPIVAVTTIETYYRDMLDLIFRTCSPDFMKPALKEIHRNKYDIDELILMHEKSIHPLELIVSNQSFQNIDVIDSVFSKFLKKGLWKSIVGMEIRVKDKPDTETKFTSDMLKELNNLFNLRHELVHNPDNNRKIITREFHESLASAFHMLLGSDLILGGMISEHIDPDLEHETP